MPKKPVKDPEEIYESWKNFNFINADGIYLPYNDNVWDDAVKAVNNTMKKAYVYQYVTQNRHELSTRIHQFDCSKIPKTIKEERPKENEDNASNWSMGVQDIILEPIRSTIHLNTKQWQRLDLNTKIYANQREYEILEPGWTGRLYAALLDNYKLPCPFKFKNAWINHNENAIFLTVKGSCPECSTKIHMYSLKGPDSHGIDFHISTFDTREIVHNKKRQLRGNLRKEVVKDLRTTTTHKWRLDQANERMDFEDSEPKDLYSSVVLRKAKQQEIDKELGTGPTENPILEVVNLKSNAEFAGSIHEVCFNKFYVMYWTPEQILMYKKLMKTCAGIICIDATGSVVKPLSTLDGSKSTIFLYQAVGIFFEKTLPIFQMISEKHDANTLQYWIGEWLRSGVKAPRQVVTDFSLALLNACSIAFNHRSLKNYLTDCYTLASNKDSSTREITILRIDIAHLIHLVSRWPCFKKDSPHVKDFFLKSIGILSQTTSIQEFRGLCSKILTVAKHEFMDFGSDKDHINVAHRHMIEIMKKGYDVPQKSDDILGGLTDSNNGNEFEIIQGIEEFISEIDSESSCESSGDFPNPYYCLEFARRLLILCRHFLLWTSIMPYACYESDSQFLQQMRVASSARCEAYFKDFKHSILKNSMRVDKVLITHVRSLSGTTKLLCAWDNKENDEKPSREKVDSITQISDSEFKPAFSSTLEVAIEPVDIQPSQSAESHRSPSLLQIANPHESLDLNPSISQSQSPVLVSSTSNTNDGIILRSLLQIDESRSNEPSENMNSFLNQVDSWGGKLKDERPKRGYHLRACPDIENKHKRPRTQRVLPLLVNGNSMPPVKISKSNTLKIRNTCGFDALIHCIQGAYADWITYNTYIEQSDHHIFQLVKLLSTLGAARKVYESRANILLKIVKSKEGILDCHGNIGSMTMSLMLEEPSIHEYKICNKCDDRKEVVRGIMDLPDLIPMYERGMEGLQESMQSFETGTCRRCSICKGSRTIERIGGAHLIIDIEGLQSDELARRANYNQERMKEFCLDSVPIDVQFGGAAYKLTGVIAHIPGHYIPYIRRITGRWECHDGLTKSSRVHELKDPRIKKSLPILFYVRTV